MSFVGRSHLGPEDLVLCAGTVPGTDIRARVEAAASAGYRGIGLRAGECLHIRGGDSSVAELRTLLADHDLEIGELDGLTHWATRHFAPGYPAGGRPGLRDPREAHEALWWVAEELGARTLNVMEMDRESGPIEMMAAGFAALCDRAEPLGMLVQLEFLPWSGIPDPSAAAAIVRLAGRANGGLCLDTWHLLRSGQGPENLVPDLTDLVVGIQVNDASATAGDDLLHETQHRRLLPGQGAARVAAVLRRLRQAGVDAPVGVEVMSDELATLPPAVAAARAAAATRTVLAEAATPSC